MCDANLRDGLRQPFTSVDSIVLRRCDEVVGNIMSTTQFKEIGSEEVKIRDMRIKNQEFEVVRLWSLARKNGIIKDDDEKKSDNSEGVRWFFTWNNIPESKWESLSNYMKGTQLVDFLIYQIEKGEYGTTHAQGCFHLNERKRWKWLMKNLAEPFEIKWFLEPVKKNSNMKKAAAYCSKDETRVKGPYGFGDLENLVDQGKRSDLDIVNTIIDEGVTRDVKTSKVFMRYPNWCNEMERLGVVERSEKHYKEWFEKKPSEKSSRTNS